MTPRISRADARGDADRERHHRLAADIGEQRALDPRDQVVLGPRAREHAPQEARQPGSVEQHVDRDHDHEHQVEETLEHGDHEGLHHRHGPPGVALQVGDVDVVHEPPARADHVHLDRALTVDPVLQVAQLAVGGRDAVRIGAELVVHLVCDRLHLARDHGAGDHADPHDGDCETEVHKEHRDAAGEAHGAERAHDRVQQDRDQRGDHEDEHGAVHGRHEQPRSHHDQRQAHELYPPRDQDLPRAVWRHRGHRSSHLIRPSGGALLRARQGRCVLVPPCYPLPWHP